MREFILTPFCLTFEAFRRQTYAFMQSTDPVGPASEYEERATVRHHADGAEEALEKCWVQFQNLSETHLTPDDGRSMMVGDLIRVTIGDEEPQFYRTAAFGFHSCETPA